MEPIKQPSFIYMDYNATTPLAEEVANEITDSLVKDWGNPSSGNPFGLRAKTAVTKARNQIAEMVNCLSSEVIFTSGGTEGNNMIIFSAVQYFKKFNMNFNNEVNSVPHIITSNVEHDSVILPIKYLVEHSMATMSEVKVDLNGYVNVDDVINEIKDNTCLISIMYANNETGVIMPIPEIGKEIAEINRKRDNKRLIRILFHTDAAQIIGKENISFQKSHVDFMTVVGHKFYGPRIGCICAKTQLYPLLFGGGQEGGLRPGTENTPMIVGLGVAANLVKNNIQNYTSLMYECREKLEERLKEVFGDEIVINCKKSKRLPNTSNISFKSPELQGVLILSKCQTLIASVGAACHSGKPSQILVNSGVPVELAKNAIRLSVGRNTTLQNIEDVVMDLKSAVKNIKLSVNNY